jgi:hypothetical protein
MKENTDRQTVMQMDILNRETEIKCSIFYLFINIFLYLVNEAKQPLLVITKNPWVLSKKYKNKALIKLLWVIKQFILHFY